MNNDGNPLRWQDSRITPLLTQWVSTRDLIGIEIDRLGRQQDGQSKKMAEALKVALMHSSNGCVMILRALTGIQDLTMANVHEYLATHQRGCAQVYHQMYRPTDAKRARTN